MSALAVIALVIVGVALATALYFVFVPAPRLFTQLEPGGPSPHVRDVFARFYLGLLVCGVLAAALAGIEGVLSAAAAAGTAALAALVALHGLVPRMNRHREAAAGGDIAALSRLARVHLVWVGLNAAIAWALGGAALFLWLGR